MRDVLGGWTCLSSLLGVSPAGAVGGPCAAGPSPPVMVHVTVTQQRLLGSGLLFISAGGRGGGTGRRN